MKEYLNTGLLVLLILMVGFQTYLLLSNDSSSNNTEANTTNNQSTNPNFQNSTPQEDISISKKIDPSTFETTPNNPADNKAAQNQLPATTMTFAKNLHDFGEIEQGDIVQHSFQFQNTGSEPLIISNASGSCGCTVPTWSKEPIQPGEFGKMDVQFDSNGKSGDKTNLVTITANTEPSQSQIQIRAFVKGEPVVNVQPGSLSNPN